MDSLEQAVKLLGSREALGEAIGVSKQAISHWFTGRRELTAEQCRAIEIATRGQVTRAALRPDLFGPLQLPPTEQREQAA